MVVDARSLVMAPGAATPATDERAGEGRGVGGEEAEDTEEELVQGLIDDLGFGRFHGMLFCVAGLGWCADVAEIFAAGILLPVLKDAFGVDNGTLGLVTSATFLGMLCGSWFWGVLGDVHGRKMAFFWTSLGTCVFVLASATATSFAQFVAWRLLVGFCLGGNLPVDFALFLEWAPRRVRDKATVYLTMWSVVGTLVPSGAGWLLLDEGEPRWRTFLIVLASISALTTLCRPVVPESPRFLVVNGKGAQCAASLRRVATMHGVRLDEVKLERLAAVGPRPERSSDAGGAIGVAPGRIRALFEGRAARRTTGLLLIVWLGTALGFYGFVTWAPTMLRKVTGSSFAYFTLTATTAFQLPSLVMAVELSKRGGPAKALAAYALAIAVSILLFWALPSKAGLFVAYALFNMGSAGFFAMLYLFTQLCFETRVRTTGFGFCAAANRLGGMAAPVLAGLLYARVGAAACLPFALCFAVVAGAALLLAPSSYSPVSATATQP